jgi:hypothetical protein
MAPQDDWRLQGQEKYLSGRRFAWAKWVPAGPDWDHDHCEFCSAEFAAEVSDHAPYDAGWVTVDDDARWVCPKCFVDFEKQFAWVVECRS